jgi:hypothetical protein
MAVQFNVLNFFGVIGVEARLGYWRLTALKWWDMLQVPNNEDLHSVLVLA